MKRCILFLFALLFLCTSAYAFPINFDQSGSGEETNLIPMDEWSLSAYPEPNDDSTLAGADIFTYQDIATGDFEENFTVSVPTGRNAEDLSNVNFSPFYADIFLGGNFDDSTNTVKFNDGNIVMYDDQEYGDPTLSGTSYPREFTDGTDTVIAKLDYESALVSTIGGSLTGENNLGITLDLEFTFTDVNPDYFGETEQELVDKSWLLSVVGGSLDQETLDALDQNDDGTDDTYLITWDIPDLQAEFKAVPEPTTLLLFGTGLLGLAAFGRKKFMKKS